MCLKFKKCKWHQFDPWVRKILWRRKWLPTPVISIDRGTWRARIREVAESWRQWANTYTRKLLLLTTLSFCPSHSHFLLTCSNLWPFSTGFLSCFHILNFLCILNKYVCDKDIFVYTFSQSIVTFSFTY